jgi:hypothetical protein
LREEQSTREAMRMSDAPIVPSYFRRVTSSELLRKNEVLVHLGGAKKPLPVARRFLDISSIWLIYAD